MPPELKDYDWNANQPQGMTALTLSEEYNQVWTALESGLTPGGFRMLPYEEQAELTAYWYVHSRMQSYYADEQKRNAEQKQREMELQSKMQRNRRL
jgi:hypothetical protein